MIRLLKHPIMIMPNELYLEFSGGITNGARVDKLIQKSASFVYEFFDSTYVRNATTEWVTRSELLNAVNNFPLERFSHLVHSFIRIS